MNQLSIGLDKFQQLREFHVAYRAAQLEARAGLADPTLRRAATLAAEASALTIEVIDEALAHIDTFVDDLDERLDRIEATARVGVQL